jgi:aminoglycoside 3-N-acetyltransferase
MVQKKDIVKGLSGLGVSSGDVLMVHSSLSSFGRVEGGEKTVLSALLSILGEEGTLVMPAFSRYLQNGEDSWDREKTPSLMGRISETFRTMPGTLRSNHAAHSICARGKKAELLCRRPYKTGFGPDSPFKTLLELDAIILLMGVSYQVCTFFHLLEAEAGVPYRFLEERKARIIRAGKEESGSAWEYTRKDGAENDFSVLGNLLEERGMVRTASIGGGVQKLFRAASARSAGMERLREDKLFLLSRESRRNWEDV